MFGIFFYFFLNVGEIQNSACACVTSRRRARATRRRRQRVNVSVRTKRTCERSIHLVREGQSPHSGLHPEDVVVDRKERHSGGRGTVRGGVLQRDGNLRIVDAAEVTGTGRLVLFRLKRERVRVHARHRRTGVVLVSLDGVKVLTALSLHPVLPVENKLEFRQRTRGGSRGVQTTLLHRFGGAFRTVRDHRAANISRRNHGSEIRGGIRVGFEDDTRDSLVTSEVPEGRLSGAAVKAPH